MIDPALSAFPGLDALSSSAGSLLDGTGGAHLFTSRPWYESFIAAGLPPGASPLFFVLSDPAGMTRAILPCQRRSESDPSVSSLTSFYSCDFRPLIASGADAAATVFDLGRSLSQHLSAEAVIGFDSLDSGLPTLTPFLAGLGRPGRVVLRYGHFGRWWESVEGRSFPDYLAARDGALREVIRRKGAKLEKAGAVMSMIDAASTATEIERGIADYEAVYAASWKEPEPFPQFQPTLMRNLAVAGWLRLALCRLDSKPIAAQLWVCVGGTATVLKLAHDRDFDGQSPGTVLTAFAIRMLMEKDRVVLLDFGRGDDAYKRSWATNRTLHIGVLSVSIARRPMLVARHLLGALIRGRRGPDFEA